MSELILCGRSLGSQYLKSQCGVEIDELISYQCRKPGTLAANTPYLLSKNPTSFEKNALSQLSRPRVSRKVTKLSMRYGGDNLSAIAHVTSRLLDENKGSIGAATSVYAGRMDGFTGAVKKYQAALLRYRDASQKNSKHKVAAKQQAKMAFNEMQRKFSKEVKAVTGKVKSSKGLPLNNVKRGLNIARSSRNVARLNLTNQVQVNNIVKFTKHAKVLGNGLAVIDFGSRIGNVHNSYKSGGNWERDLFIDSSSFAASATTALITVKAGLSLLVFATPFGWAGLIIGGLAIASVTAYSASKMDRYVKNNGGSVYDDIMKWISSL